jgi:hypothetical protein
MDSTPPHPVTFLRRALLLCSALVAFLAVAPGAALAAPELTIVPMIPSDPAHTPVTVDRDALPADVLLTNTSSPPEPLTICNYADPDPCPAGGTGITITPSCAAVTQQSNCLTADPDVFLLNRNAVGVGPSCAGMPFIVVPTPPVVGPTFPTYTVYPQPDGTNLVLPASGSCRIAFTFDVLKQPTIDAFPPPTDGLQTISIASATGRSQQSNATWSYRGWTSGTVDPTPPPPPAPPASPLLTDSAPRSPANDNAPQVIGSAPRFSTVRLYTNATCSALAGQGTTSASSSFSIPISVTDNSTTTLWGKATDATSGLTSACSTISLTYVEDSIAPPPAAVTGVDPASPANDNGPRVRGTTAPDPSLTVRIFTNAGCTGAPAASGSAAQFASPGIEVIVPDNSTTAFYAATFDGANQSSCSPSVAIYTEDSAPPPPPVFTETDPGSPASVSTPRIKGTADAGSYVRLYTGASCAGPAVGVGTASVFASPGIVVSVPTNATTTFYGTAEDTLGNLSACSTSFISYVQRSTTPPPPPPGSTPPPPPPGIKPPPPPPGSRTTGPGCSISGRRIVGTSRNDTRTGTAGSDVIFGRAGSDLLSGLGGSDCLYGEAGNDRLSGGSGADRLFGGPGADRLDGGSGNDRLAGAAGNDRLTDRSGRDNLSGGAGNDTIDARDSSGAGRRVADTVRCGAGRDVASVDRRDRVSRDCERVRRH